MTQLPDTTTEAGQREASVMLARLSGWEVEPDDYGKMWIKCPGEPYATTNLYQPVFMFLAWRVLNWVQTNMDRAARRDLSYIVMDFTATPAAAQRAWLDKVLSLAIEAGMLP